MLKHYSTPNRNRIINFEPTGPKVTFAEGKFSTEDEATQKCLENHPQFNIQFFCDELISPTAKEIEQNEKQAEINKDLVDEVKRLRAKLAQFEGTVKPTEGTPNPDEVRIACEGITKDGRHCLNDGKTMVKGQWLCYTHAKAALGQ